MCIDIKGTIELIAAITMAASLLLVIINRHTSGRGIGARAIQFLSVGMIIPAILILSLEKVLEPQTTATIIGALTGYLLSGLANYDPREKNRSSAKSKENSKPSI